MNKEQINTSQEYQYLQFVDFRDLGFWDARTYAKVKNQKIGYEPLGLILSQRKGSITIDDNLVYKRCRVQIQSRGIILRDQIFGKEIKTKRQQVCKADDFLVAEIDAKVGGFGIVSSDLEGAVVSSHYFLFEINKSKLLPEFLGLVIKFEPFLEQVKATGSTNYAAIRPHHVLEYQIPLPPLPKQQELVATYNQKTIEAEAKEQKANQLEKSIDEYLIEELGIEMPQTKMKQDHFLKFVEFKDLSEWDVWNKPNKERSYKYKTIRIDESLEKIKSKVLKLQTKEFKAVGEIPIISQEKDFISGYTSKNIEVVGKEDLPLVVYGDHSQIKKLIDFEFVVGADGVKLLKPIKDFDPLYFLYFLETIKFNTSQKYTRHFKFLKKELIPLPPLPIQNQIADKISSIKEEIKTLRNEAENLKIQAKEEFENEVF